MIARLIPALALSLLASVSPASAQAYQCSVPDRIPGGVSPLAAGAMSPRRVPVTGYTLSISWSPQYCRSFGTQPGSSFQCGDGNRFGFVLHGLWPDGVGRNWPQYCRPAGRLPDALIRRQLCITPSADLIRHEWAKHGTCTGLGAQAYFDQGNTLFGRLRYPDMNRLSRRANLRAGQLAAEIARANRGLSPSMIRIATTRGGWLDEVRVCLDTRFRYKACPADAGGAPVTARVKIWRGGR